MATAKPNSPTFIDESQQKKPLQQTVRWPKRENNSRRLNKRPLNEFIKVAIVNHKGGVSKSTSALNLGGVLAEAGYRTLLIDCDPSGDLSSRLTQGQHEAWELSLANIFAEGSVYTEDLIHQTAFDNLSLIPCDRRLNVINEDFANNKQRLASSLAEAITEVADSFDAVLLDGSPGAVRTVSSLAMLCAATEVLMPCQVDVASIEMIGSIESELSWIETQFGRRIPHRIFLTQVQQKRLAKKNADRYRQTLIEIHGEAAVMKSQLGYYDAIHSAKQLGKPVVFHRNSKASENVRAFTREVLEKY